MNILIHYAEIGIKGKNRSNFENLLMDNIRKKAEGIIEHIKREPGHFVATLAEGAEIEKAISILKCIPGIAYFMPCIKSSLRIEEICKDTLNLLKDKEFTTFKIDAKRRDKNIQLRSVDINQKVGGFICDNLKKTPKMKDPDITVRIETSTKFSSICTERIEGVGGLPTDPKKRVIALLSGGIDSPVAAFLMMKRGCEVILVHFHNQNQASRHVKSKIEELKDQLSKFQQNTKLYIIPFESVQKEIITKIPSEKRMLVFRKCMIYLASKIADKEKAKFLVVGDSLSQVASQTLENLEATYFNSPKPILTPLIGLDKNEITKIAVNIGTYDISSLPYPDCCSMIVSSHPELKARSKDLDIWFSKIDKNMLDSVLQ